MSWVSLSLATVAIGAWTGTFTDIPRDLDLGEWIERLRHGVTTSLTFLSGAFVAALLAKGKGRAWTVASALIIPVQCLMWFGFVVICSFVIRRYRNFAPFVRQIGEGKAQACAMGILHQAQGENFIARLAALIFLLQIARVQDKESSLYPMVRSQTDTAHYFVDGQHPGFHTLV